ncbi:MAG: dTDP-4-dehydrorhamnose 3,5-epimerase [Rhizomicrobium sp.]
MKVIETAIPEIKLIEPRVHHDGRGFFLESWNARAFAEAGIDASFVQDNHSRSAKGVLRGLHYQIQQPQAKLIRVIAGSVYDVAVDIRRSSPSYGRWVGVELSAENKLQMWIPTGFAHGFLCLQDDTEFLYKCTDFYAPEHERALLWNDPALAIEWPSVGVTPSFSSKDLLANPLARAETFP